MGRVLRFDYGGRRQRRGLDGETSRSVHRLVVEFESRLKRLLEGPRDPSPGGASAGGMAPVVPMPVRRELALVRRVS